MTTAWRTPVVGRADRRLVPQRGGLPAAARRVAVAPAVALPELRDADQALRQHPGALVAAAARALPHLREPISARYPLVEAGTGLLCALVVLAKGPTGTRCSGSRSCCCSCPITLIDLDHRIIPNKITLPGRGRWRWRSSRSPTPTRCVEHLIAARRPAASSSSRRSPTRAGWGWGTSSSRSCWACSWAAPSRPRCSSR